MKFKWISVFSPNTGKYGKEKSPYLDNFYAVNVNTFWQLILTDPLLSVCKKQTVFQKNIFHLISILQYWFLFLLLSNKLWRENYCGMALWICTFKEEIVLIVFSNLNFYNNVCKRNGTGPGYCYVLRRSLCFQICSQ